MDDREHPGGTPGPPAGGRSAPEPTVGDHSGEPPGYAITGQSPRADADRGAIAGSRQADANGRNDAVGRPHAPTGSPEDDADAEWARFVADLEAGRERVPEAWETEGPAVTISLGDAADLDPALLAAVCGPDGIGGQGLGPLYGQNAAADTLRPLPLLSALTGPPPPGSAPCPTTSSPG